MRAKAAVPMAEALQKVPTGIQGFDEITKGGLPEHRVALVTGGAGSGKTLFSIEYLVRGAAEFNEPGLFVAFEETADELEKNVASLGFNLRDLQARELLAVDHVAIERAEIEETGDYDLEGLFVRLAYQIDAIKAKRVVLDTLEALFSGFPNELILRAELRRLFRWLKDRKVTTVVTAEKGHGTLTRHGLEEYVSDCVVVLDHLIRDNVATRRLRAVKYRGSQHGTNEYPFLIGNRGISVLPITSLELKYDVSDERVPSGIPPLDAMLSNKGFYKGSSVLISGTAGTGKSTFASTFVHAACNRGERALYLAFEESPEQIIRNMRSVGVDLRKHLKEGLLHFHAVRPTLYGLEMHLVTIHDLIQRIKPEMVVFDPISNLVSVGDTNEVKSMLTRMIDFLKMKQITTMFTSLTSDPERMEETEIGISSLMDTWIVLRDRESGGERNRQIHLIKSRGMAHSNQLREFLITDTGIQLRDVYVGRGKVYTGSARTVQEAADRADETRRQQEIERRRRDADRKRRVIEAQITALQAQLETELDEADQFVAQQQQEEQMLAMDRSQISLMRKAQDNGTPSSTPRAPASESKKKQARR